MHLASWQEKRVIIIQVGAPVGGHEVIRELPSKHHSHYAMGILHILTIHYSSDMYSYVSSQHSLMFTEVASP